MFETNNPQGVGLAIAGAPTAGTSCVQTLTIGGTPTGGSFRLAYDGLVTGAIAWSATDATLIANIKAALEALPNVGPSNTAVAAGTGSSGIGTYTITAANALAKLSIPAITVASSALAGTAPTVAMAVTTAGVTATLRGAYRGTAVTDHLTGRSWVNVGTPTSPSWARSDVRTAVVPLTATSATTGGAVAAWAPPEGGPVLLLSAIVYTTTKSTGAATCDIGTAADAVTSSDNLIDGLDIGTAVVCADNITDKGTNGKSRQLLAAGQYVTVTGSADTAGLVGTLYLRYLKP